MLPGGARLRRSADFAATLRLARGSRGDGLITVHLAVGPAEGASNGPRVGFVVPRSVGSAVSRNRVRRRLRHLVRDRLDRFPPGTRLVVRVLPPAATASSATLGSALDAAIDVALNRALAAPTGSRTGPA